MTNQVYLFPDLEELASFIKCRTTRALTPLRLHKSIYLLHAYYSAAMALSSENKQLVDVQFEPWSYGPVVRSIWSNPNFISKLKPDTTITLPDTDIELLASIIEQINEISDYTLSERTKADDSFIKAHAISKSSIINNDDLILEYIDELTQTD